MTSLSTLLDMHRWHLGCSASHPIFLPAFSLLCEREIKSNDHLRNDCTMCGVTITMHFGDSLTELLEPLGLSDDIKSGKKQAFARWTYWSCLTYLKWNSKCWGREEGDKRRGRKWMLYLPYQFYHLFHKKILKHKSPNFTIFVPHILWGKHRET